MFPVLDQAVFAELKECLDTYVKSDMNTHQLTSDGTWIPRKPITSHGECRAQEVIYKKYKKIAEKKSAPKQQFIVRRKG